MHLVRAAGAVGTEPFSCSDFGSSAFKCNYIAVNAPLVCSGLSCAVHLLRRALVI